MNPEYENKLEASVRRELDALGELSAPPALAGRILRAIEKRTASPAYRQSWSMWPLAWRTVSLAGLLVAFAGVCFGVWELTRGGTGHVLLGGWFAEACALGRTLGVLTDTLGTLLGLLGSRVIGAGLVLIFATWVACIGLGTVYVRFAMRPAVNRIKL
jgi:hypothetical protein